MAEREYCAERSLVCGETMVGSADHVDAWLMFEHRAAWSARPLEDGSIDDSTGSALSAIVRTLKAAGRVPRVQLIRQSSRQDDRRRLFVQLAVDGVCDLYGFDEDFGVPPRVDVEGLLDRPAAFAANRMETPHYFVCTNGQRDLCCARFGLPVYAALAERVGARAWQTTHVGGHRFAPNVLVLPAAALYGRVTLDSIPGFLDTVERGGVATDLLRGRSWREPAAQAAEIYLQRETGKLHDDAVEVTHDGADRCRVSFPAAGWHVDLRASTHEQLASCGDTKPKPVQTWSLVACHRREVFSSGV